MIHPVIHVRRDQHGALLEVLEPGAAADGAIPEWIMHAELVRETDPARLGELLKGIERVLDEVRRTVDDSEFMRDRATALIDELEREPPPIDVAELDETTAFLAWAADGHFTFLGYREYDLVLEDRQVGLRAIGDSGLGMLRGAPAQPYTKLRPRALGIARTRHALVLTKANSRATVHRPAYLDYIGVKRFGPDGEVAGERRFLGLYNGRRLQAERTPGAGAEIKGRHRAQSCRLPSGQPQRNGAYRDPRVLPAGLVVSGQD